MSFKEQLEDLQDYVEGIADGRVVDAWIETKIHERSDGPVLIIRVDRASDSGLPSLLRTLYSNEEDGYWVSGMKPAYPYDGHAFEIFVREHPDSENIPNKSEGGSE